MWGTSIFGHYILLVKYICIAWTNVVGHVASVFSRQQSQYDQFMLQRVKKHDKESELSQYTADEVAKHKTADDCWIIINKKVYDVSGFGAVHPGREVVYSVGGTDATDVFACFHKSTSWNLLDQFLIGTIKESTPPNSLISDFRKLRAQLMREGLFRSSRLYYTFKFVTTWALFASAVAILAFTDQQPVWVMLSGMFIGLFWQQSGWLAHDFLHHQVDSERKWNNFIGGYILGDIAQGFSMDWWKRKHNLHHACPNQLTTPSSSGIPHHIAVDPDIDTLPLLAWSSQQLDAVNSASEKLFVRWQHVMVLPLLSMARMVWAQQSLSHVAWAIKNESCCYGEVIGLLIHYGWLLGIPFSMLSTFKALLWIAIANVLCGLFLSIVFVTSHNGMAILTEHQPFVVSQIASTRNVYANAWNNWFTGGLNYQIEHHLFPTLPRHNFHLVAPRVRDLCQKHGLKYECVSFPGALTKVVQQLHEVAKLA